MIIIIIITIIIPREGGLGGEDAAVGAEGGILLRHGLQAPLWKPGGEDNDDDDDDDGGGDDDDDDDGPHRQGVAEVDHVHAAELPVRRLHPVGADLDEPLLLQRFHKPTGQIQSRDSAKVRRFVRANLGPMRITMMLLMMMMMMMRRHLLHVRRLHPVGVDLDEPLLLRGFHKPTGQIQSGDSAQVRRFKGGNLGLFIAWLDLDKAGGAGGVVVVEARPDVEVHDSSQRGHRVRNLRCGKIQVQFQMKIQDSVEDSRGRTLIRPGV
jgi:hypothetical protein